MLRPGEQQALSRLDAPVLVVGDDGRIAHVDGAALRALGWDASLVGRSPRELIPERRRGKYNVDYAQLALGHWPSDGIAGVRPFLAQDGQERMLHSQVGVFRRPDGSRLLCATLAPDAQQARLDALAAALGSLGYTLLTPAMH